MNEQAFILLAIFYGVVILFAGASTLLGTCKFHKGNDPADAILGFFITFFFLPFFIAQVFYYTSSKGFWEDK